MGNQEVAALDENKTVAEQDWGEVTNGLRIRALPVLDSNSEDSIKMLRGEDRFANVNDIAFAVELKMSVTRR